jgi:hypothetical protein
MKQAEGSIYYLIVSAYDFEGFTLNQHRLAWRTRMTVQSQGVSMNQSFPALIAASETYLGRETTAPMLVRRSVRDGTVKFGPLKMIEDEVIDPSKAAPTK